MNLCSKWQLPYKKCYFLGNTSQEKKNVFFRAISEKGGGEAPARIFWTFFYHVLVPKIGNF